MAHANDDEGIVRYVTRCAASRDDDARELDVDFRHIIRPRVMFIPLDEVTSDDSIQKCRFEFHTRARARVERRETRATSSRCSTSMREVR